MSLYTFADKEVNGGIDNSSDNGQGVRPEAKTTRQNSQLKDEPVIDTNPIFLDDMDTPAVVRAILDRLSDLPVGKERDYEREFKLSFYYEGFNVAMTPSDRGPIVVASGTPEEVLGVLADLPRRERGHITLVTPQPLRAIVAELLNVGPGPSRSGR